MLEFVMALTIKERVKYYLGYFFDHKIKLRISADNDKMLGNFHYNTLIYLSLQQLINRSKVLTKATRNSYVKPLVDIWTKLSPELQKKYLYYSWGDIATKQPDGILVKTRPVGCKKMVLFKLSLLRHWQPILKVKKMDIPFEKKKDIVIWRGATTGGWRMRQNKPHSRYVLVKKYFDHPSSKIDVGFSGVCQGENDCKDYVKPQLTMKQQLEYKYLLSAEGNDVASGLKWMLYSNSVVFMGKPSICSWAMEDKLKPYIHYIPIEKPDWSDLEEKLDWATRHPKKCRRIAANATAFIEQFRDKEKEAIIQKRVLKKYLKNVEIVP